MEKLVDNFGRTVDYLRIAVTDRCNLRCFYCMPEEGINYLPKKELLSYEEILRLVSLLAELGFSKVRITGGEPFVRRDLLTLIDRINNISGISNIHITTNGVLTHSYLDDLKKVGIKSVNLSLDTLDAIKFEKITRRNEFENVMKTLDGLIERNIPTKINMVVMAEHNTDDIVPMVELSKKQNVEVRFIEEMPFNGDGAHSVKLLWNHERILQTIKDNYPKIYTLSSSPNSTAKQFQIEGFIGGFGIIPAYSRTFCNTCNRLRLTSNGTIKTCLYDDGILDFKTHMRSGASDFEIKSLFKQIIGKRAKDGYEAEKMRNATSITESMSSIGG